jgi:hypothetical protein
VQATAAARLEVASPVVALVAVEADSTAAVAAVSTVVVADTAAADTGKASVYLVDKKRLQAFMPAAAFLLA